MVVQALSGELAVEQGMNPAVGGFLSDKPADFRLPLLLGVLRQHRYGAANGVDEKLFPEWKAHRQRIEEGRPERVAPAPLTFERGFEVDQQSSDHELAHRKFAFLDVVRQRTSPIVQRFGTPTYRGSINGVVLYDRHFTLPWSTPLA